LFSITLIIYFYIIKTSKKLVEQKEKNEELFFVRLHKQKLKKDEKVVAVKAKPKHSKEEIAEHFNNLYKDFGRHKERINELTKKYDGERDRNKITLKASSKKFVLRKFVNQFKAEIINLFKEDVKDTTNKKLNLFQIGNYFTLHIIIVTFFKNMSLIRNSDMVEYVDQNVNSGDEETQQNILSLTMSVNLNQSTIKRKEKKLLRGVYDALRNNEGLISIESLFLFLLSLFNLYDYYLVKSYKKKNPKNNKVNDVVVNQVLLQNPFSMKESTLNINKKEILDEKKQREIDEMIANTIRDELSSKVKVIKKYCSFDENNNIIITFQQASLINVDFNQFYMNWSNYDESSKLNNNKRNNKKILEDKTTNQKDLSFIKIMNKKSRDIYSEYRKKIKEVHITHQ